MWRRAAFGVGRTASATPFQTSSVLPRSLSSSRTATTSSRSSSSSRGTFDAAGDRPARSSYGGRGSSSSSSNGSSRGRGAGRGRGGRQQQQQQQRDDQQQWNSNSSSSGGGRGSGSSSSGARSPGPPPLRARDILLKPRRPSAAGEQRSGGSSDAAAAAAAAVLPAFGSSSSGGDDPTYVPRDPKVQDGPWSAIDRQLVIAAQRDAEQQQARASRAPPLPDQQPAQSTTSSTRSGTADPQAAAAVDLKGFVLLGKTPEQLSAVAQQLGQPKYRGKQMLDSLLKGCRDVVELAGLPKGFKEQLAEAGVVTGRSVVHHSVKSPDGTQKLLLQLAEGRVVETVGIPTTEDGGKQRLTVCVSSQVGCPMRCTFCATGKGGFARNLAAHEIVDQVMTVGEVFGTRPTNVVFMGMGEPLLNIPAVVAAASFLKEQVGLSGRALTISTVGVPNAIAKLAQHQLTATLAVSIHAPNQELREALIPSARVYPLQALMRDCQDYFKATGRRVTFEYTLMGGTNDEPKHAQELAALLRQYNLMSHVNLIPWNPVDESPYSRPGRGKVTAFKDVLEKAGIPVSVRTTRGLEASAACGQLRNQFQQAQLQDPKPLR